MFLAGDFQAVLGTDLTKLLRRNRVTWDWFEDHVQYLLNTDTAIGRLFRPPPKETRV